MNAARSAGSAFLCLFVSVPASAQIYVLNSEVDVQDAVPGDGTCATAEGACTLRAAIQELNATCCGNGIIILPPGTYQMSIPGTDGEPDATGDFYLNRSINIVGAGAKRTIIDAGGLDRVFDIGDANPIISGVTLRNGLSTYGGAILNGAEGLLTLRDVELVGNSATLDGGALYNCNVCSLSLTNVTVAENSAGRSGGGIFNDFQMTLGNTTISGNSALNGGGIFTELGTTIASTTIVNNSAAQGGGLFIGVFAKLVNTIIAGNTADDCGGTGAARSMGGNIDGDQSCALDQSTDQPGVDPRLAPLAYYGGQTRTHALTRASPAIDTGLTFLDVCPATDQRGQPRPADGDGNGIARCDIGAFELQARVP